MNTNDLLSKLTALETLMSDFSYEELNIDEATTLKYAFLTFKNILERKLTGEHSTFDTSRIDDLNDDNKLDGKKNDNSSANDDLIISKVSHEIRTPLSGILGFTDLLLESKLSQEQLLQVSAIQSASHLLIDIVNELLEYSKLSSGAVHLTTIDFNLRSLINDVTFLCETLITENKVRLTTNIDKNIPKVLIGDPTKLSQILLNLLGNAIKFVQDGDIKLNVNLKSLKGSKAFLEFIISDTGIGISEEQLEHIFDPFTQSEKSNTHAQGHGLGLSIVKRIVEVLDGDISVASKLGQGTTFHFNLPYEISKGLNGKQKPSLNKERPTDVEKLDGKRILVFEDNLLNQKLIEQRLKTWRCKVIITDDANYGLELLENNNIDLILMDLWMPIMTGFEAAEHIRQNQNEIVRNIPIIALTADLSLETKELCKIHGINDFVLKPYDPEALMSTMLKCLDSIKSNRGLNLQTDKIPLEKKEAQSIIDLTPILKECMGDLSLLEELVRLYKQNALEFMGAVKFHLQHRDFENIKFSAHKIKSGLAMMRTYSLSEIAFEIHNVCESSQDVEVLRSLAKSFADEYLTIEMSLNEQLEEIRNSGRK